MTITFDSPCDKDVLTSDAGVDFAETALRDALASAAEVEPLEEPAPPGKPSQTGLPRSEHYRRLPPGQVSRRFLMPYVGFSDAKRGGYHFLEVRPFINQEIRWLEPVVTQLATIMNLQADWNSYGAPPVKRALAVPVLRFLASLIDPDSPPPSVVPTASGGLQLEWHMKGLDLELEFRPDFEVVVSGFDGEADEEFEGSLGDEVVRGLLARCLSKVRVA